MLYKALSYTFTLALTLLTLLAVSPALTAQPHGQPIPHSEADLRLGTLTGRIVDEHGEGLIGATVRIIETGGGQVTDFDGNYSLQLAPGTYTVEIAYVGYETKQIQEVNITAGKETSLSVDLAIADNVLGTVVVTGSYKTSNTAGAMKIQQSMPQLSTVVSSEMIGKTADKNLGEALKRVTGVTTMSNKYVAVRGMGERWNEASLDGIPLPSTESNSKAFGFDLIPTSLIDNVTVLKTATPDVSGNFSGGLIQITTRDIPTKDFISISAGTSYNSLSTFQTQKYRIRGKWDWLGYDDGRRTLPKELHEIPFDPYNPVPELFEQSKRLTTDNFTIEEGKTPLAQNYQVSLGKSWDLNKSGNHRLGLIASLTYRNTQQQTIIDHIERGEWMNAKQYNKVQESFVDTGIRNSGANYKYNTTLAGVLNIGWQRGTNRLSLRNTYTHKYDNDLSELTGLSDEDPNPKSNPYRQQVNYPTFQDLLQNKLSGKHQLGESLRLDWALAHTYVQRNQKDAAFTQQVSQLDEAGARHFYNQVGVQSGSLFPLTRAWYLNHERDFNGQVNVELPFDLFGNDWTHKFKAGYDGAFKENRFEFWELSMHLFNTRGFDFTTSTIADLIKEENMRDGGFAWDLKRLQGDGRMYHGRVFQNALYAMLDDRYSELLRLVWGLRVEHYLYQELSNPSMSMGELNIVEQDRKEKPVAIMPSINLTITPIKDLNVRLSYSRNTVRPQFMERTAYRFYDPFLGGEIFNQSVISTTVDGADLRVEWYPGAGEVISIGGFYRYLDKPIERIAQKTASFARFYMLMNSNKAHSYGVELELRKNFGFIPLGSWLEHLYLNANATFTQSIVTGMVSRADESGILRWVPVTQRRPMYSQVPYMYNVGLSYESETFGANLTMNRSGRKLVLNTNQAYEQEYEAPFSQLDAQLSYTFPKYGVTIKVNGSNLLNAKHIIYTNHVDDFERAADNNQILDTMRHGTSSDYDPGHDNIVYQYRDGISLSASVSWTF